VKGVIHFAKKKKDQWLYHFLSGEFTISELVGIKKQLLSFLIVQPRISLFLAQLCNLRVINNIINIMSSSPASSRPHRRPRPRAIPRSTSPATPVTPLTSDNYEWLWCDDHSKITKWFLTKSLSSYEEFYASFINFANTAWETSHRESHAPLKGMEKFVVELLKKERIPADEFIATLERYSAATKKRRRSETKGLIKLHPGLSK
jgi:hypothetical protein